jgi:hypothetical protein
MILSNQEIAETFVNTPLEENYNFLQADLVKLANAFIKASETKIREDERRKCVAIAKAYNGLVADKIAEVRARK